MANDDAIADLEAKLRQIQEEERLLARREDLTKEREQVRRDLELERRYEDYKGIQGDTRKKAMLQRNQQASQARKPVTVTTGEAEIIPPPEVSVGQAEDIQTISPRGEAALRLNQAAAGRRGILEGATTFRGSKETQEAPTEVVGEWAPADPLESYDPTLAPAQDQSVAAPEAPVDTVDGFVPGGLEATPLNPYPAPAAPEAQAPTQSGPVGTTPLGEHVSDSAAHAAGDAVLPGGVEATVVPGQRPEGPRATDLGVPEGTEQYAQDASYAVDVNVAALVDSGLDPKMAAEIAGNEDLTRIALDAARGYDEKLLFQRQLNDIDSAYADEKVAIAARRAKLGKQFLQEKKADLARLQEMKVDPNRFLQAGGMGRKLAMLAGVVLSGLAGGNQNMALQFIERMVDRDIDAQKANINQANRAFQLRDSYYQTALAHLGDEELAALETHRRAKVMLQDKLLEQLQTAPHHKQAAIEATLQGVYQSQAETAQRMQDRQIELAEKLGKIAETDARTDNLRAETLGKVNKLRGGSGGAKIKAGVPVLSPIGGASFGEWNLDAEDLTAAERKMVLDDTEGRQHLFEQAKLVQDMKRLIEGGAIVGGKWTAAALDEDDSELGYKWRLFISRHQKALEGSRGSDRDRDWYKEAMPTNEVFSLYSKDQVLSWMDEYLEESGDRAVMALKANPFIKNKRPEELRRQLLRSSKAPDEGDLETGKVIQDATTYLKSDKPEIYAQGLALFDAQKNLQSSNLLVQRPEIRKAAKAKLQVLLQDDAALAAAMPEFGYQDPVEFKAYATRLLRKLESGGMAADAKASREQKRKPISTETYDKYREVGE